MTIFTQFVWLAGILLEGVILIRAIYGKFLTKYYLFYLYIASVFLGSIFLYVVDIVIHARLGRLYWSVNFMTLSLGCGVIFEISRQVFAHRVTLDRVARWSMAITFGAIFFLVSVHAFLLPQWNPTTNSADLERDLRIAQAIVLMTILFLAGYYRIETGKNIKGMILGLGVYVGASILSLSLRLLVGPAFDTAWSMIQSSSYLAALSIWAVALWSYDPGPAPRPPISGGEYRTLAGRTQELLGSINDQLDGTPPR
ncbi:MAG TPA: hypothetical protein VN875_22340 [Candidatus Binatus sp.]|jgi:hypothetical protein|nr:hypothetical protein [Candidatus Binatus sp.]